MTEIKVTFGSEAEIEELARVLHMACREVLALKRGPSFASGRQKTIYDACTALLQAMPQDAVARARLPPR